MIRVLAFLITFISPSLGMAYTLDITVEANKTKINEAPWDGVSGSGAGKGAVFFGLPTSGPPDLAICVIALDRKNDCKWKMEGKNFHSYCQNSFDCDFKGIEIETESFALVIVDLDVGQHDFVDAVVLTRDTSATGDMDKLEAAARAVTNKLAPALTQGERQRRERPLQRFELSQCAGTRQCILRQSVLRISE